MRNFHHKITNTKRHGSWVVSHLFLTPLTPAACPLSPAETSRGIANAMEPDFSAAGGRPFHRASASALTATPVPNIPMARGGHSGPLVSFFPLHTIQLSPPIVDRLLPPFPFFPAGILVSRRCAPNWVPAKSRRMIVYQPVTCAAQWHGAEARMVPCPICMQPLLHPAAYFRGGAHGIRGFQVPASDGEVRMCACVCICVFLSVTMKAQQSASHGHMTRGHGICTDTYYGSRLGSKAGGKAKPGGRPRNCFPDREGKASGFGWSIRCLRSWKTRAFEA